MKKISPNLLLLAFVALLIIFNCSMLFAQPSIPANSPAGINGKLKVIGTKLCNQYDKPIQLRGMSTHGIQWFYNQCYGSNKIAAFDTLKSWGADILRISMYVQEDGYETDPTGFTNKVKTLVDVATARGMYALIDFHQLDPGDPNYNTARAKTFFTAIATACKNYPNVIYDICNEPNGNSVTWPVIKNYADQVIPVIRAIDDEAVVFVGTHGWATFGYSNGQSLTSAGGYKSVVNNKLNYPNIMYTFHFYADSHGDPYLAVLDAASNELPVFVTEFGFQNAAGEGTNNRTMSDKYITLMRNKKIGWCNWNYSDDARTGAVWKSGGCSSNNWTTSNLKEAGIWIRDYIRIPADDFPTGGVTNTPPSVSITGPANGSSYTAPATVSITANATDANGTVSKVEFYIGTTLLGTDNTAPYSVSTSSLAAGNYAITAKATDNAGATTTSAVVNIVVNSAGNTPPSVSITGPANGSSYTAPATVSITANATDANGTVSKVEFYIGTTLLGTDNTAPYSVSASSLAAGNYAITAKATDNAGATTTSAVVNIIVNSAGNTPPSVSITGPANGSSYTAPATVSITANATDANGTVSKVEFYIGTTLLGTDNTAPYSVSASSLAAGNYAITAKATDNAGATTTSAVVNISVTANTNTCSGVPQYQQNGGYVAGSRVQNAGSIYECKPFPYSGWCNGASWAYGAGTGAYWSDAWIKIGSCSARLSGEFLTEEGLGSYQVSPNPFSAEITIQLPSLNATYTLFVSDTKGKIHQTLSVTNQSVITVGNDLPSGIYFLEITDGTESYVTKIMKY